MLRNAAKRARASGEASAAAKAVLSRSIAAAISTRSARRIRRRATEAPRRVCPPAGALLRLRRRKIVVPNDCVNDAEPMRLLRVEALAKQQKFTRFGEADTRRNDDARRGLRCKAKVDERHPKNSRWRRVNEVAMKEKRDAYPDGNAIDGGDEGLLKKRDPPKRRDPHGIRRRLARSPENRQGRCRR